MSPNKLLYYLIRLKTRMLLPFVLFYIFAMAATALYLEPDTFETYLNALYWVMTTLATVGYGDYAPTTPAGRVFTILLYASGIGLVSLCIGKVIGIASHIERLKVGGRMKYKGRNHIILVGWNEKTHAAILEILTSDSSSVIVVIDTLEKAPLLTDRVHYIRGDASDEEILLRANLPYAKGVILFADQITQEIYANRDPLLVDGKTLLIATAITSIEEKWNVSVHVTAEVINQKHMRLFKHVRVDEFVPSQEMISHAAVRSVYSHGVTKMYTELLTRQCEDSMYEITKHEEWRTYRDAFEDLLNQGATLVADRGDLHINHKLDQQIPDDAQLYVICDADTYSRLNTGDPVH